jgi:prepilin-type N-terminal cleavage/methylation domain-containing protein
MGNQSQSGFGIIEMILGIVVVGVVSLVGLHIYQTQQVVSQTDASMTSSNKVSPAVVSTIPVPAINTTADLQAVSQTLDAAPLDDAAALNDLDAQLSF